MDLTETARIAALELLVANLIAEQLRTTPEPVDAAAGALRMLLGQVEALPLTEPPDQQAMLRSRIGDALGDVMKMALRAAPP
jgi:hypothetical protein